VKEEWDEKFRRKEPDPLSAVIRIVKTAKTDENNHSEPKSEWCPFWTRRKGE